jgi:G patch domain-containing protein 1
VSQLFPAFILILISVQTQTSILPYFHPPLLYSFTTLVEIHRCDEHSSIAASIRRALMPPLEDSPGVRLLKKMGWRLGQGVGPRVSWRTRKIQDLLAAGKSIDSVDLDALNGNDDDDADEEAKRHLYPPRDTVVPRVPMKTDAYGIGFRAGAGLMESLGEKRPQSKGPKLAGA